MPMGTPEPQNSENPPYTPVHPYAGFKFDPMTGKRLAADATPTEDAIPSDEDNFTHYLHLADGRIKKSKGTFTHYFESDAPNAVSVPVIGVYPR